MCHCWDRNGSLLAINSKPPNNIKCANWSKGSLWWFFTRKDAAENIIKIARCLKEAEGGWLWIREISRRCNIHHKTVSRLISKHLGMFIETQTMEPFNVHMIRLKSGSDINGIFRFIAVKEKLENESKRKRPVV